MPRNKMREFSLTNLFFVTGFSFLAFTAGLRFLDGVVNPLLLKIGLAGLGLGVISLVINFLLNKWQQHHSGISTDNE